jgi:hypothetical protein
MTAGTLIKPEIVMPENKNKASDDYIDEAYRKVVILEFIINNDDVGLRAWLTNPACDVDEADMYGNYAVTLAASNNNFVILELLQGAGARFDVSDGDNLSPLDYAEQHHNTAMANFIRSCVDGQPQAGCR